MTAAVTDSNGNVPMPLADATDAGSLRAPVRAGARARVPATLRNGKIGAVGRWFVAQLVTDLRGWWLLVDRPGTVRDWLASTKPARVPADNVALRAAGTADQWVFGLIFAALSVALFLLAGLCRWLAGHPVRRWAALLVVAAGAAAGVISTVITNAH